MQIRTVGLLLDRLILDDDAVGFFIAPSGVTTPVVAESRRRLGMFGALVVITLLGAGDEKAIALNDFIAASFANLVIDTVRHERQRNRTTHSVAYRHEMNRFAFSDSHGFVHEVYQVVGQLHAGEGLGFLHGFSEYVHILRKSVLDHGHGHFFVVWLVCGDAVVGIGQKWSIFSLEPRFYATAAV